MKTVTYPLCDGCKKEIRSVAEGCILHGNILAPDFTGKEDAGGLLGKAYKKGIEFGAVEKWAYCKECFISRAFPTKTGAESYLEAKAKTGMVED